MEDLAIAIYSVAIFGVCHDIDDDEDNYDDDYHHHHNHFNSRNLDSRFIYLWGGGLFFISDMWGHQTAQVYEEWGCR